MKNIVKKIINFYNTWYGVINVIIGFFLLSCVNSSWLMFTIIGVSVIDAISWYKNIFKNFGTKSELFGTVSQNMAFCIYGGIGCGKSTLAEYIINRFIPFDKQYRNTNYKGSKAVTWEHLMLQQSFEESCGVIIDEAGAQVDAYHYSKSDNDCRKRLDYLNKYFRQWYGDKSLLIYVDQCQGNMNTSLHKNIYYVIQCKSLVVKGSALVPYLITKIFLKFLSIFTKKRYNNPFSNVCIEYMEFEKLGDYAEHYSVTIQDKDHKKLVGSIYEFFTGQNTYVFRDYNPAKKGLSYVWGSNTLKDRQIMNSNFNFDEMKKQFINTFEYKE